MLSGVSPCIKLLKNFPPLGVGSVKQAKTDSQTVGNTVDAGLPNFTGVFRSADVGGWKKVLVVLIMIQTLMLDILDLKPKDMILL